MRKLLRPVNNANAGKICFIHIPKCGGTSTRSAIGASYGVIRRLTQSGFYDLDPAASLKGAKVLSKGLHQYRKELLVYFLANPRSRYVAGHFSCSDSVLDAFCADWHFITLLRHPVDRWFSHYFYNRYKDSRHLKTEVPLEEYVESDVGQSMGSLYVRTLTDMRSIPEEEAVSAAIETLERFAVVGVTERMDAFLRDFQEIFGVCLNIGIKRKNPLSSEERDSLISDSILHRVEEICSPDLQVYEHAINRIAH